MKAATLVVLGLGIGAAAFLVLWGPVAAEEKPPAEAAQPLEKVVQGLKAELAQLAEKHDRLKADFDKLKEAFGRHTHPVKFWDPGKKEAAPWKEAGSFFIAYPKVGTGDQDADAVTAGGTWGTP